MYPTFKRPSSLSRSPMKRGDWLRPSGRVRLLWFCRLGHRFHCRRWCLPACRLPLSECRCNPVAQKSLPGLFGGPLAAPSANPSGKVSPTRPDHVLAGLDGRIEAVLDGGVCSVGLEFHDRPSSTPLPRSCVPEVSRLRCWRLPRQAPGCAHDPSHKRAGPAFRPTMRPRQLQVGCLVRHTRRIADRVWHNGYSRSPS